MYPTAWQCIPDLVITGATDCTITASSTLSTTSVMIAPFVSYDPFVDVFLVMSLWVMVVVFVSWIISKFK